MRFTIVDGTIEFDDCVHIGCEGRMKNLAFEEVGYKIKDMVRNRLEMGFYYNDKAAQDMTDKLNRTRPQTVWSPKKKGNK
jgi:hypothetical protein